MRAQLRRLRRRVISRISLRGRQARRRDATDIRLSFYICVARRLDVGGCGLDISGSDTAVSVNLSGVHRRRAAPRQQLLAT